MLARARTAPLGSLNDALAADGSADAAAALPVGRSASESGAALRAAAAGARLSRDPSPSAAASRPCSLFRSCGLPLVEPPSVIAPMPCLSVQLDAGSAGSCGSMGASPLSAGASPFVAAAAGWKASAAAAGGGGSGALGLHHSRSDEALASSGSGSGAPSPPGGACLDLGPPRASMDGFLATSSHLSEGSAAEELFYRLNHARQTLDFVKGKVRGRGGGRWARCACCACCACWAGQPRVWRDQLAALPRGPAGASACKQFAAPRPVHA